MRLGPLSTIPQVQAICWLAPCVESRCRSSCAAVLIWRSGQPIFQRTDSDRVRSPISFVISCPSDAGTGLLLDSVPQDQRASPIWFPWFFLLREAPFPCAAPECPTKTAHLPCGLCQVPHKTLLTPGIKLSSQDSSAEVDPELQRKYREIIGSLMYLYKWTSRFRIGSYIFVQIFTHLEKLI